jgi:hypothetical protein
MSLIERAETLLRRCNFRITTRLSSARDSELQRQSSCLRNGAQGLRGFQKLYHRKKHHNGEVEAAIIQLMAIFLRLPGQPSLGKEGLDSALAPASEAPTWKDEHKLQAQRDQAWALVRNEVLVEQFREASSTSPVPCVKDAISLAKHAAEQVALAAEIFASRFPVRFVEDHLIFSHHLVETGDDICILLGCNYPVVLRPEGPFYRVVGECYSYDLKDGETMGWLDSGKCAGLRRLR